MVYSVILAGGAGTRLWPLSRAGHPKFLHALTGTDRSLLQATVDRSAPLAPMSRTYVVTGASHAVLVARQLPAVPEGNILVEPSPRDSCAAVGLAAAVIAQRDPSAVMAVFSADHLIKDEDKFRSVVQAAVHSAEQGYLVTIGITPTRPEPAFGHLKVGPAIGGKASMVEEFKEKPPYDVAVAYTDSGEYLWNAGMFVFRAADFLAELARQKPALHEGLSRIAEVWDEPARDDTFAGLWPQLEKISIDYAVMEGAAAAGRVATVPGDFGWSDVGDFHSLAESLPCDENGNLQLGGEVVTRDVRNSVLVPAGGRLIAVIGAENMVVVDTADAVLVCPRDRTQEVKQLVDELKERGSGQYV
ncbi:mannose-1-phosphate guanylyltransferase [Longispora albida]|uniref:mannose-1-phosphate guanylyltransferase n=1 Tax=Longispora albida TaxID=203523 RepID=UPI000361BFAF|nr:mannose-1-phosphate guanylyltransferase [Longispora albida]